MSYLSQIQPISKLDSATLSAISTDLGGPEIIENQLDTLWKAGNWVMSVTANMNSFAHNLVNKVFRVEIMDKMYRNKLSKYFRGTFELGDTVESIFVNIAAGFKGQTEYQYAYNPHIHALPDIKASYHPINVHAVYPVTVPVTLLRGVFTSWGGLDTLRERIVNSTYRGMEKDREDLTRLQFARLIVRAIDDNRNVDVAAGSGTSQLEELAIAARTNFENFQILDTEYNEAGVWNYAEAEDIDFVTTTALTARQDVSVLASAFNMDKAEFKGKMTFVKNFEFSDAVKLRIIQIITDPLTLGKPIDKMNATEKAAAIAAYWPISSADQAKITRCLGITLDKNTMMIYDQHEPYIMDNPNGYEASINYFLHVTSLYATNPFTNCVVYTTPAQTEAAADSNS